MPQYSTNQGLFHKGALDQGVSYFSQRAELWWDTKGPFSLLHRMNAMRVRYILEEIGACFGVQSSKTSPYTPLKGLKILDVGCGGGLVCEPLARLGASVTGLDLSREGIEFAKHHAQEQGLGIQYICAAPDEFAAALETEEHFDVVLALEVIEHTLSACDFLKVCTSMLKKRDGLFALSTLNRTFLSLAMGIWGAEYLFRFVPKGTHSWQAFVKPDELRSMLEAEGLSPRRFLGFRYHPLWNEWSFSKTLDVNYIMSALWSERGQEEQP